MDGESLKVKIKIYLCASLFPPVPAPIISLSPCLKKRSNTEKHVFVITAMIQKLTVPYLEKASQLMMHVWTVTKLTSLSEQKAEVTRDVGSPNLILNL